MSYRIFHRPSVTGDIEEAMEYYEQISSRLSDLFLQRLIASFDFIIKTPKACQVRYRKVRTCLIKQFPYHIHYLINEKQKVIYIVAVIHSFSKPKY